jgi:hypothetical protein
MPFLGAYALGEPAGQTCTSELARFGGRLPPLGIRSEPSGRNADGGCLLASSKARAFRYQAPAIFAPESAVRRNSR